MSDSSSVNTERWRAGYGAGRKSFWSGDEGAYSRRLRKMGLETLSADAVILDVGCGNGGLIAHLVRRGWLNCFGVEPDRHLVADGPARDRIALGSASALPTRADSCDAVIFMSALHHLRATEELKAALAEAHRVLRDGGLLAYCEPAATLTRKFLTLALGGPIASLSSFARAKRAMVEEERVTLAWWLSIERHAPTLVKAAGFGGMRLSKGALKSYLVARKARISSE